MTKKDSKKGAEAPHRERGVGGLLLLPKEPLPGGLLLARTTLATEPGVSWVGTPTSLVPAPPEEGCWDDTGCCGGMLLPSSSLWCGEQTLLPRACDAGVVVVAGVDDGGPVGGIEVPGGGGWFPYFIGSQSWCPWNS